MNVQDIIRSQLRLHPSHSSSTFPDDPTLVQAFGKLLWKLQTQNSWYS
jgi:hypothetical protein